MEASMHINHVRGVRVHGPREPQLHREAVIR